MLLMHEDRNANKYDMGDIQTRNKVVT